jgi:hypothetical protein
MDRRESPRTNESSKDDVLVLDMESERDLVLDMESERDLVLDMESERNL